MKLFAKNKDGGSDSNVTGYWLIEWKSVFSIALLKFDKGSREAFHSHAFNCVSWVLSGLIREQRVLPDEAYGWQDFKPSLRPVVTTRDNLHRVYGIAPATWVLTFRGPWNKTWREQFDDGTKTTLAHGRRIIEKE